MEGGKGRSRSFQEVELWKKAHAWVLAVYRFTERFPKYERFGLAAQLRDAAVSVPANFAEGFKRRTRSDKARSYNIAQSSLEESRYFLMLSRDLEYGDAMPLLEGAEEIARMLEGYVQSTSRPARGSRASEHRYPDTPY